MIAPLTRKKLGSTRCVGCEKRFTDTPDAEVVEREATDYAGGRPGYSASRPVKVMRRWHVACIEAWEAGEQRLREQVKADQLAMLATLCEAAGLDPSEVGR